MTNYRLIIVVICANVWLIDCTPTKRKRETNQQFHRTGEGIALDEFLQKYEREHQKFYMEEIRDGDHLEWPALDYKNLSDFCKEYLNYSVPAKTCTNTIGIKIIKQLNYKKQDASSACEVAVVKCKIMYRTGALTYYITRAPEDNCVYALKCTGNRIEYIYAIINKYCDFENNNQSIINSLKRKGKDIVYKMHRQTGQPIAKDNYLLEYELEHQELHKREGKEGECLLWPHAMVEHNLDSYCGHYMEECAPNRKRVRVSGRWKTDKLNYQKLGIKEDLYVTTITCLPFNESKRQYHMTRALESNCVYALLRNGSNATAPLVIIYKHCDFEHYDILIRNKISKTEIKEEPVTLQLLPKY